MIVSERPCDPCHRFGNGVRLLAEVYFLGETRLAFSGIYRPHRIKATMPYGDEKGCEHHMPSVNVQACRFVELLCAPLG